MAKHFIETEFDDSELRREITKYQTIDDLVQAVTAAKDKYEFKKTSKTWRSLSSFSARVKYYGAVMDVLAQHHPEYVSLAWGTLKFLFTVRLPLPNFLRLNMVG